MNPRLRTINRMLSVGVLLLAGLLIAQLAMKASHHHEMTGLHASWRFAPQSTAELDQLANEVVVGKVVNIRRGNDIVVKVDGEPGNVDRIPTEVVTLQVDQNIKGNPGGQVEVFHTGLSVDVELLNRPVPKKPVPSNEKMPDLRTIRKPTPQEANRYSLHDDPGYEPGQKYLLYLAEGPEFAKGTRRIVAPEGRFLVAADTKLIPTVDRGAALELKGKPLPEALNQLRQMPKLPIPQVPKGGFPGVVPRGLDQGDAGPEAQGDGPQAESLPPANK